jgi:outer membrane protein assembly factor BamE
LYIRLSLFTIARKIQKPPPVLHIKSLTIATLCLFSLTLSGCSMPKMPKLKIPRVHKITVQQGNVITQEMVDKLKPGMSRSQVAYVMGEPVLRNTFNENRWDYIYTIDVPGYFNTDIRMSLFFEGDVLSYFTGDLAPTSAQGIAQDVQEGTDEPTTEG